MMARQKLKLKESVTSEAVRPQKKATEELKIAVHLKLDPDNTQRSMLDSLRHQSKDAMMFSLKRIKEIHDSYQKLEVTKEKICDRCKEIPEVNYLSKEGEEVCSRCFIYSWSILKLTMGFQKELVEAFPNLALHKGYYSGVVKGAVPAFKSWLAKVKDREKEIQQLMEQINLATNAKKKLDLEAKLKDKQKGIKDIDFRGNVIFLGAFSMFEFIKQDDGYYIGLANPHKLRDRINIKLDIGDEEDYKTDHNKFKIIDDAMAVKEKRVEVKNKETNEKELKTVKYTDASIVLGKIIFRSLGTKNPDEGFYEFIFPKRELSSSMTSRKEIADFLKENPKFPVVSLSFGIKTPVTAAISSDGKILERKTFGDASLWHKLNRESKYRKKVMEALSKRYGKWHKRKALRKFFKKRSYSERRFIRNYVHSLTKRIIFYFKQKYGVFILVMQDLKGIKRISYPYSYRAVLSRWNVEMQRFFIKYKSMLKNCHLFEIPYRESNHLTCRKCGLVAIEDNKKIVSLTSKLLHASEANSLIKNRIRALSRKVEKLQTYPLTSKMKTYIQLTKTDLTNMQNNARPWKISVPREFKCQCGNSEDFYTNEALVLQKSLSKPFNAVRGTATT